MVAGSLECLERFLYPSPLGGPVCESLIEPVGPFQQIRADCCVKRELHLVNRYAVRGQLQRRLDRGPPVFVSLTHHAGDQVDVDLGEVQRPRHVIGAENLRRTMRPPVHFQYPIVEVLDSETEARDAHPADRG